MTAASGLSVVVAAWNGEMALRRCLGGLAEAAGAGAQVIVARNYDLALNPVADFPWVTDLPRPPGTTVPRLRAIGLEAARGEVVAFLEDHAEPVPGWAGAILSGYESGALAVGGPVAAAGARTGVDWAGYFADYGPFMPPCTRGPVAALSGINMSYRRAVLADRSGGGPSRVAEAELQYAIRKAGGTLWLEPSAAVVHWRHYQAVPAVRHSYHWGRGFAGSRFPERPRIRRLLYAAGTPVLPAILMSRAAARLVGRRGPGLAFLRATPWLALFFSAWAVGECSGYLFGAGRSEAKWL